VRIFLVIAGLALLASCAPAQSPAPPGPIARNVPGSADLLMPTHATYMSPPSYPTKAVQGHVSGHVDFTFTLQPDGSVADAKVVDEVPTDLGFAEAALRVFPHWKFPPKMVNGVAVAVPAKYRFTYILQ
jgi:protein TonB